MPSFSEFLAQGNGWLFFPVAIFLGALHGLEPGHSKTMMTAFIIAIRGTIWQAFLLGVSATISHTALIWVLAFVGLHYSSALNVEDIEPYLKVATGIMVIGLALWMLYKTRQSQREAHRHGEHGGMMINTGHGWIEVSIFETNTPPRFRVYFYNPDRSLNDHVDQTIRLETIRPQGLRQTFSFLNKGDYFESIEELPEPHEFKAIIDLKHGDHGHTYNVNFDEHHHNDLEGDVEFGDAHERAHALDIQKKLANQNQTMTTGQIILFGLTGGLLPCPSALAVLLLCLQLKKVTLGFALVFGFSIGLALTLVTVGTLAAISVKHATKSFPRFGELARKIPYASSTLLIVIGCVVAFEGLKQLI